MDIYSLILQCQEGDKEAIGLLYKSYSKQMMRIVCHYVMDWQAAQDILHDGFLIIFSRIKQLREPSKLEYWMAAIMKNLSLQYLKEQDITQLLASDYDIPDVPEFEDSISIEELEAMISRLPKGYQKVFRLAVLEHKSHKEIGKLLGISESTSGSQLFHARAMIRKMIIEYKIETGVIVGVMLLVIGFIIRKDQGITDTPIIAESTEQIMQETTFDEQDYESEVDMTDDINRSVHPAGLAYIANGSEKIIVPAIDTLSQCAHDVDNLLAQDITAKETSESQNTNTLAIEIEPRSWMWAENDEKIIYDKAADKGSGFYVSIGGTLTSSQNYKESNFTLSDYTPGYTSSSGAYRKYIHDIPVTLALSMSKSLSHDISVESGLQYSLLQTTIEHEHDMSEKVKVQYIGLPLRVRMYLAGTGRFSVYGTTGAMVDFPISGKVTTRYYKGRPKIKKDFTPPIQWSATIGAGIEYNLTSRIGIYAEPSLNYFFKAKTPYPTIRQERPLELNLPIGVRYKW